MTKKHGSIIFKKLKKRKPRIFIRQNFPKSDKDIENFFPFARIQEIHEYFQKNLPEDGFYPAKGWLKMLQKDLL